MGVIDSLEAFQQLDSELDSCSFEGVDFSQWTPSQRFRFLDCTFRNCNLSNLKVMGFVFRDVHFEECKLVGINWSSCATFSDVSFSECKLDLSSFQRLHLKGFKCHGSSLRDVDFSEAILSKSSFSESNLLGATFNGCDLSESDFRSAKAYSIHPLHNKLKGARFSYPEVGTLLSALGIRVE